MRLSEIVIYEIISCEYQLYKTRIFVENIINSCIPTCDLQLMCYQTNMLPNCTYIVLDVKAFAAHNYLA